MKLRFGKWLPATLAACALVACANNKSPPKSDSRGAQAAASPVAVLPGPAADATNPVYTRPVGKSSDQRISEIRFTGAAIGGRDLALRLILSREAHWYRQFSADYLQMPSLLVSKEHYFNADIVKIDELLLKTYYQAHGYQDVSVNAEARPDALSGDTALSFGIAPGKRYRFGKISLTTDIAGYDPEDLRYAVDLRPGDWYEAGAAEAVAARLNSVKLGSLPLFTALGHHLPVSVCIRPLSSIDAARATVDLVFRITRCRSEGRTAAAPAPAAAAAAVASPAKPPRLGVGKRARVAQVAPAVIAPAVAVANRPPRRVDLASAPVGGIY
ncbi:MAG: hypothetical protein WCO00_12320 [Rhodospirillaceae bacterium]